MLTKQICLVLGAGASQPYGFPTGGELMGRILDTQPDEWWPLAKAVTGFDKDEHAKFVLRLRDSGVASVDQFAGSNQAYKKYAKALIAYHIGKTETSNTVLQAPYRLDWLNYIMQEFINPAQKFSELHSKSPHVITFNYDRLFEEGILRRLSANFEDATRPLVADMLRTWKIVHVHGSLGPHPELTADGTGRPFNPTLDPAALEAAIDQIILVRDAADDSREFTRQGVDSRIRPRIFSWIRLQLFEPPSAHSNSAARPNAYHLRDFARRRKISYGKSDGTARH